MRYLETIQTDFQTVEVWKSGEEVEFRVAGAVHAWFHRDHLLSGLAWDLIAAGSLLGVEAPRSVLMLGLAGGTSLRILRQLLPNARFVAVEIDAGIVAAARKHMHLDSLEIEIHIDDGYRWLESQRERFDVVIDDAYLAGEDDVFRPRLPDERWLRYFEQVLSPEGVMVVNLVTGLGHRKIQSRVRHALLGQYPEVGSLTAPDALNEALVAGPRVHSKSRIKQYAEKFSHPIDRAYWQQIALRRLRAR
ncbi:MAG: spermidine synthase [Luteolibacter sp.]